MRVAWDGNVPPEDIRLSVQCLYKNIYHLHYSVCAWSKSCSGRCIWDGYFSL